jgi:hypothetical protein
MKILFLFLLISSSHTLLKAQASKEVYEAPNLKMEVAGHRTIAILPIKMTISYKKMPKDFSLEGNKLEEQKQGLAMQSAMYTYLLKKSKDYTVTCQDVENTNILLKNAGLFDKLSETLKDSICKVLKVDAIITANYAYERTGSEAGAIAKTLLFGVGGGVASGLLTMTIYNGKDGTMLWRFTKEMIEGAFSSANEMFERMMRKVSRNYPYDK